MVELISDNNGNEINSVTNFIPNCDPLTMFFVLPFMPAVLIMKFHMNMMQQLSQNNQFNNVQQQKTKVTSITRTGNTLDIIEKWV